MSFRDVRRPLSVCILLAAALTLAIFPARAQAPNSPVGNHLVGTILGTPETQSEGDFREQTDHNGFGDFVFRSNGDLILTGRKENRLYRVGADGMVVPFAGDGSATGGGDGGQALEAGIAMPSRLAADASGNVYVSHWPGELGTITRIRRISSSGVIDKVVGGDTAECPEAGSPASSASLTGVGAMAVSQDAFYFSVDGCNMVYRVGADGLVSEFAGTNRYDPNRVDLNKKPLAFPANRVAFERIVALAVDAGGNVLVADRTLRMIFRVTPDGVAMRIAGIPLSIEAESAPREGSANSVLFPAIWSMAMQRDGSILVAQASDVIVGEREELGMIEPDGNYRILFTSDEANGRPSASLGVGRVVPNLVRVAPDGGIYIRDRFSGMILRVLPNGSVLHFLGKSSNPEQVVTNGRESIFEVRISTKLVADSEGNLYVGGLQKLYRLSPDGTLTHIAGNGAPPSVDGAPPLETGLAIRDTLTFAELQIDGSGSLYWESSGRIRKLTKDGVLSTIAGSGIGSIYPGPIEGLPAKSLKIMSFPAWVVAANGDLYFILAPRSPGYVAYPAIWRVGADGLTQRVAGLVNGQGTTDLNGAPAKQVNLQGLERLSVAPDGTVYFGLSKGIYWIDSQGIIRLAANGDGRFPVSDGGSTITAPPSRGTLRASASDQVLVAGGSPLSLARYTVGGTVQVWRDGASGALRNDGAFLKDDRFVDTSTVIPLPDGGIAWLETHRDRSVVRRSFPVPSGCTYAINVNEISVSGGNSLPQVTLTTGANCPWTVGTSANWVEILGPRYGKGTVTLNLRTLANVSPVEREATLRIAGKEVRVRQGASTLPNIFVVSPVSAEIPPAGGSVQVSISASSGMPWQVALPGVPVNIQGPSAGSGSASFVLSLDALPANLNTRTAIVTINDKTVTLRQTAVPSPVPVTINSSIPGTKATIDLVERTLPYVAQWLPGSYHLFQAAAFTKVTDNTLIQFQNFGTNDSKAERIFITPSVPSTITAEYRRLHRLRVRSLLQGSSPTSIPATNFRGITVPQEIVPTIYEPAASAGWYPEGARVEIFAPESSIEKFAGFTGGLTTTENPTSVQVSAPTFINANYTSDYSGPGGISVSGNVEWWFYGEGRQANAAQLSVETYPEDPQAELRRFVAYQSPIGSPEWLALRSSNARVPLTLEVGVDAGKAADLPSTAFREAHQAIVYLHQPGAFTNRFWASARIESVPGGALPWISALTDAGGFRQSVGGGGWSAMDVAPGMILSIFGLRLGSQTIDAQSLPLPTELGGVSVELQMEGTDTWTPMPLFFVSPTQINFQISPTANWSESRSLARFRVRTGVNSVSESWHARIRPRSVSLFSADSSGSGAPAGFFVRVLPNQTQQRGELYQCSNGTCVVPATAFGGPDNNLFLELFGTGFHNAGLPDLIRAYIGGRPAEIAFAGPHPVYVGLDQVNIKVPRDIAKGSSQDLYVWVKNEGGAWIVSNRLTVRFQ